MMALPPIPPGPEPTDAELLPYFDEWTGLTDELLRSGAALSWRMAQQAKTPDNFLRAFAPPDHQRYLA